MAQTSRLSPLQIQTDASIPQTLEACWHGFSAFGVSNAVIDPAQNVVVGSTGMTLTSYGQTLTARLEARDGGTLISLRSEAQMAGTIDFGAAKRQAARLGDAIEAALQRDAWSSQPGQAAVMPETRPVAPIAAPTAPIPSPVDASYRGPRYGVVGPIKKGTGILVYGLLGVTCCGIAAPFALGYGIKALKDYGPNDPGDRTLVIVGIVLGAIGTLFWLLRIAIALSGLVIR